MKSICLYFSVHQPVRLRIFRFFEIGNSGYYYDDHSNETMLRRIAKNCYLPSNKLILDLINKNNGAFKVSFSISGTALDQFKIYAPEVIESFRELADTGCVEFLAETYSHSLAAIKNKTEFRRQVKSHSTEIETLFGKKPSAFANTNLIYSDEIGEMIADMGYKTILTRTPNHIRNWRNPNYIYHNAINSSLNVLLKNDMLSDDVAFRFSNTDWRGWPLTVEKYVTWINIIPEEEKIVNLFMDYETFGERQKSETGIFDFLNSLPLAVFSKSGFKFRTPSEVATQHHSISTLNVPHPISWTDEEGKLTARSGNELQQEAFENLYELSDLVDQCSDPDLLTDWKYLQTSDHFDYMSTKYFSYSDVKAYFSPYESPYEAFMNYMNVLNDFSIRLKQTSMKKITPPIKANKNKLTI